MFMKKTISDFTTTTIAMPKWWAFFTLCALPVELQRGRRPISIKNHDMAQETPRFSEDGPWTRDLFARQGTLISFFPRLWTRDTRTFIIIYTSIIKSILLFFCLCNLYLKSITLRNVDCVLNFHFFSDVILVKNKVWPCTVILCYTI